MKKLLSILLVLCMVITLLPTHIYASEEQKEYVLVFDEMKLGGEKLGQFQMM